LSPEEQASVQDAGSANKVLLNNNSMIKRPLIESPKGILLGFDEEEYKSKL
jgi:arsenate reductase-like glutaredoxin family protein